MAKFNFHCNWCCVFPFGFAIENMLDSLWYEVLYLHSHFIAEFIEQNWELSFFFCTGFLFKKYSCQIMSSCIWNLILIQNSNQITIWVKMMRKHNTFKNKHRNQLPKIKISQTFRMWAWKSMLNLTLTQPVLSVKYIILHWADNQCTENGIIIINWLWNEAWIKKRSDSEDFWTISSIHKALVRWKTSDTTTGSEWESEAAIATSRFVNFFPPTRVNSPQSIVRGIIAK